MRELEASSGERRITAFLKRNAWLLVSAFSSDNNTFLVCPEFRFGNRFRADFVVLSGNSGEWNAHLIELEPVGDTFFISDGTDSKALRKAKKQVGDWNHYIKNHPDDFREELFRSSCERNVFRSRLNYLFRYKNWTEEERKRAIYPHYHIVIGRRAALSSEDKERRSWYYDYNRCQLITYDRFVNIASERDANQREHEKRLKDYAAKHGL